MNTLHYEFDREIWAENNFGKTRLFDCRRTKRLTNLAAELARNSGKSLAGLFKGWYDTKAIYNLLSLNIMTPDVIQENHRTLVRESISNWNEDVLLIEDDSEFEWNQLEPIEGLGPIGSGRVGDQGFILHSTLAVGITSKSDEQISAKILGLPYQQYYVRPPVRLKKHSRHNGNNNIETDLWRNVILHEKLPSKSMHRCIRVCDRNADIYEVFQETQAFGYNHIIRGKHDRIDSEDSEIRSFKMLRELPAIGSTSIERRGRKNSVKRTISLNINWQEISLRAPARPGYRAGDLSPLKVTLIRVWGIDPETQELIEWFLYTDLIVNDFSFAHTVVKYYSLRWIIEDYHKALKSGLKAENLQLKTAHSLFAAIAVMSIVALRLVDLREALRGALDAPAEQSGLDALEIKVLAAYLEREIKTVKCVALAIGKLGGHLNRKNDGMPGLMTLWLGISKLYSLVEGVKLMKLIKI